MEILTGPAGSGKTSALLQWYRAALAQSQSAQRPGRTLWLSPTHRVCEQVKQQLWTAAGTAILAPQVMTFDGFADRILQFSDTVTRPLPPVMQRVLVRHLIDNHARAGQVQYFAGIAHTSGFLDVVLGLIAELKREEAWPEDFREACTKRGASRSDQELGALYQAYQDQLVTQQRYDAEGRFWSARDRLVKGHWQPFPEFELVVVDGFSDFTHTQYEILGLLARRSARMVVSLPWEETTLRPDLFAKPKIAIERLCKVAACRSITPPAVTAVSGQSLPAGVQHLARQLFSNPRETTPADNGAGLEILAATGMQGEVRAIAERVKRLLVAGVAAREITVAFRPLTDYAPLVREVFTNAGIPFQCVAPEPLIQQPLIKTLMSVLQLELEDWPFERLYGLLNSGWFRPAWPEWSPQRTPRTIAKLLRQSKIPNGRAAIVTAFDAARVVVELTEPAEEQLANRRRDVVQSASCIQRLSELLQPLRQRLDARNWAESLTRIARELGLVPLSATADGSDAAAAWNSFQDLLFVAAGTEEMLGEGRRRLGLTEIFAELTDLLQHQTMPSPARLHGAVEVLEAAQIRGLDVPYLFLGGLTESSFPQRGGDSFLYTEADRRELNAHGLTLGHRTAQTQAEMLLFYSIVTRARHTLTLSYPAVSLDGQPLSASPYLTALRDLFQPGVIKSTRIEQLDPVPEVSDMLSLADLRVVATSEALQRRPRWFQTLAAQPTVGWGTARSILAAVDMSVARFQTRGFTGFEGIITHPANLKHLQDRFSPQQEFSATQLEGYATCPFRFWVSDVLKLREVDSPDQFTDFGRRGDIVHEILRQLHSELEPTPDAIPAASAVEVFRNLLTARLSQEVAGSDLLAALIRIEQRLLDEWGEEYAAQWADYHASTRESSGAFLKPSLFEISFGTPHNPEVETQSRPYLTLGSAQHETRIRGRIDRIDVGTVGGQPVFNIIDYKTGRKPSTTAAQMKSGRSLQLVLYALATQRLNLVGDNSIPMQAGYWCLRETGWTPVNKAPKAGPDGLEPHADWLALVDVLDELVPRLAAGIRAGQFPVYNADSSCMSYCPYRTTCRVTQIRPLEETLDKHWEPK